MIQITHIIKTLFISLFFLTGLSNCSETQNFVSITAKDMQLLKTTDDQYSTIFIHGTLFGFSWLVRLFDCPLGLTPALSQANKFVLGRIPYMLQKAAPLRFPLDRFYLWGWDGRLSFDARKDASHELYHALKSLPGKKTLIGQSHGCNVTLNLAKIANEHNDKDFCIDQLILLTGPVQKVNSHLVTSPCFKKVFSLYSSSDLLQILDPQGLYPETRRLKAKSTLFSEKLFKSAPNLIQAEIVIYDKSPSHLDFLKEKFISHLADIIDLLENATKDQDNYEQFHYKINIPLVGKPYFIL